LVYLYINYNEYRTGQSIELDQNTMVLTFQITPWIFKKNFDIFVTDNLVAWIFLPFANLITSTSGVEFTLPPNGKLFLIRLFECVWTVRNSENCSGCRQQQ